MSDKSNKNNKLCNNNSNAIIHKVSNFSDEIQRREITDEFKKKMAELESKFGIKINYNRLQYSEKEMKINSLVFLSLDPTNDFCKEYPKGKFDSIARSEFPYLVDKYGKQFTTPDSNQRYYLVGINRRAIKMPLIGMNVDEKTKFIKCSRSIDFIEEKETMNSIETTTKLPKKIISDTTAKSSLEISSSSESSNSENDELTFNRKRKKNVDF